jgi:protein-tyrosine phosphatase
VKGLVDLHVHYLPSIDDGVKSADEGIALLEGLARIGYSRVYATPHIRTAMFENRRAPLEATYASFVELVKARTDLPELGLGAEHFCDDVFWDLHARGESLPFPGGKALLVEMPQDSFPRALEERFFQMQLRGVRPIVAHPERYLPLHKRTDSVDAWLDVGVALQLDLMSLIGKYGRSPQKAAERMLDEGVYSLACSDAHKPSDVVLVEEAIARLERLVGEEEAFELLSVNATDLLAGTFDP